MSTSELMTKAQQGTTYELHVGEVDIQWNLDSGLWTLDSVGKGEGGADAGRGTDPSQFVWHLPGFSIESPVSWEPLSLRQTWMVFMTMAIEKLHQNRPAVCISL